MTSVFHSLTRSFRSLSLAAGVCVIGALTLGGCSSKVSRGPDFGLNPDLSPPADLKIGDSAVPPDSGDLAVPADLEPSTDGAPAVDLSGDLAEPADLAPSDGCPSPTRRGTDNNCVLEHPAVLTTTLELPSNTTLQCAPGATITPSVVGVLDNVNTAADEYVVSVPDTGVLMANATNSKIVNCTITGFDFGVLVLKSKRSGSTPTGNAITGSTIVSQMTAITGVEEDDLLLSDNDLTATSGAGAVLVINRNADNNQVTNNSLHGSALAAEAHVPDSIPGQGLLDSFNTTVDGSSPFGADGIILAGGASGFFFNFVVNHKVYQFPFDPDPPQNNVIMGNTIDLPGPVARALRCGDLVSGGQFVSNHIISAATGVLMGSSSPQGVEATIPGSCSLDGTRRCSDDADCFFAGVDSVSKGTCVGTVQQAVDVSERNMTIADNVFDSVRLTGIQDSGSVNALIAGNRISGSAGIGIQIGGQTLVSGVVTRNQVSGVTDALRFSSSGQPGAFGAVITLNDFAGNTASVVASTSPAYSLVTELSANGQGNYWSTSGFVPPANAALAALVTDSHPFCASVATSYNFASAACH